MIASSQVVNQLQGSLSSGHQSTSSSSSSSSALSSSLQHCLHAIIIAISSSSNIINIPKLELGFYEAWLKLFGLSPHRSRVAATCRVASCPLCCAVLFCSVQFWLAVSLTLMGQAKNLNNNFICLNLHMSSRCALLAGSLFYAILLEAGCLVLFAYNVLGI